MFLKPVRTTVAAIGLTLAAWGCGTTASDSEPIAVEFLGGFPSATATDVVSYGDFAAVVTVVGESELDGPGGPPSSAQTSDGVVPSAPPVPPEGYVGRQVSVTVDEVVWNSGRVDVPESFSYVDFGWWQQDGGRREAVGPNGVRVVVGGTYLATFVNVDGEIGLLGQDGINQVTDGVLLANRSDAAINSTASGMTPEEFGSLLIDTPIDPRVAPYADKPILERIALVEADKTAETGTLNEPVDSFTPSAVPDATIPTGSEAD